MALPDRSRQNPDAQVDNRGLDTCGLDTFRASPFEETPIWAGLYENIHDLLFPRRLPPLELTSTPIPISDRLAIRTNPWAVGTSTMVNGGILALVIFMGMRDFFYPHPKPNPVAGIDLSELRLLMSRTALAARGGGGGGSNQHIDPIVGRLPRFDNTPLMPPAVPVIPKPLLEIDPALAISPQIKLPDNPALMNIGVNKSTNVTLDSYGPGTRAGIGAGADGGLGPDHGAGVGPGFDRGIGGEVYRPGGDVSAPTIITAPEAEFSDEARRAKYQGVCIIGLIVDAQGNTRNLHVVRSLGMGLDQKALDAVQLYKFKPAKKNGKPVPVTILVQVNFRLY